MRTSLDVYHKIIWDTKYQPENFYIGYRNFNKIVEVKFENWILPNKGGDIPMHRIEYFRNQNGDFLWHKEKEN